MSRLARDLFSMIILHIWLSKSRDVGVQTANSAKEEG